MALFFSNNSAREMGFDLIHGGDDGEHRVIDIVKLSKIFAKRGAVFY